MNVNGGALCFSNKEKIISGKMTMTIMQRGNCHVVTEQMALSGYQTLLSDIQTQPGIFKSDSNKTEVLCVHILSVSFTFDDWHYSLDLKKSYFVTI